MTTPASPVQVTGPLARYADAFRRHLGMQGYTPLLAANQLRVMAHLSRWLSGAGLGPEELSPERVGAFLEARRAAGHVCWRSPRGLAPLLAYLRAEGAVPELPAPQPSTPTELVLVDYRLYLIRERGLAPATLAHWLPVAERFLGERCRRLGDLRLEALTAADVVDYITAACLQRSVGSAKVEVGGLRSLLRFLHIAGLIPTGLASAVPTVAGSRSSGLPRALPAEQVARLLANCDLSRPVGLRDFAILTLLSRLGLRAGEVAGLRLTDIDWRAGEVVIRGKGRREERLPLPADVGDAVVAYLQLGRPPVRDPGLFLGARAPHRHLTRSAVTGAVRNSCLRAGLPEVGPHRLRHTAATQMLQAGASLGEVGQVLRQRGLATTSIYAKVDRSALRTLALPWPGGQP